MKQKYQGDNDYHIFPSPDSTKSSPDILIDLNLLAETTLDIYTPGLRTRNANFLKNSPTRCQCSGNCRNDHSLSSEINRKPMVFQPLSPFHSACSRSNNIETEGEKDEKSSDFFLARKRAHIVSEQKRRQSINDGFEELKGIIPSCKNNTDSKAVILRKAVNYIQSLQIQLSHFRYLIEVKDQKERISIDRDTTPSVLKRNQTHRQNIRSPPYSVRLFCSSIDNKQII